MHRPWPRSRLRHRAALLAPPLAAGTPLVATDRDDPAVPRRRDGDAMAPRRHARLDTTRLDTTRLDTTRLDGMGSDGAVSRPSAPPETSSAGQLRDEPGVARRDVVGAANARARLAVDEPGRAACAAPAAPTCPRRHADAPCRTTRPTARRSAATPPVQRSAMSPRDQYRSSYGSFMARERELERSRARRDAGADPGEPARPSDGAPASPRDGGAGRPSGA